MFAVCKCLSSSNANAAVVMQENPSYSAVEDVVSMEPNSCRSAVPAITDGELIHTIVM